MESILTSIKKMIGITEEYEHFDVDIIMHINSAFATLNQLGVGSITGFTISDKTAVWEDFVPPDHWFAPWVKSYVFAKTRVAFDTVGMSGSVLDSYNRIIEELEWRINVAAETNITEMASKYKIDYTKLANLPSINGETLVGNYDEKDPTVTSISTDDVDETWNKTFKE